MTYTLSRQVFTCKTPCFIYYRFQNHFTFYSLLLEIDKKMTHPNYTDTLEQMTKSNRFGKSF